MANQPDVVVFGLTIQWIIFPQLLISQLYNVKDFGAVGDERTINIIII